MKKLFLPLVIALLFSTPIMAQTSNNKMFDKGNKKITERFLQSFYTSPHP